MSVWPLAGMRVVDVSTDIAGSLCGKLLADAGASVQKLELPHREPGRHLSSGSPWFEFLNADKHRSSVDPNTAAGRRQVDQLFASAALYLTSSTHDEAARWSLDCDSVRDRHPHLVAACVTPFGQSGPYASFAADDLVLSALSGLADATPGLPDRQQRSDDPPVQSLAPLAEAAGGITAAGAVFGALFARRQGMPWPRHVEVCVLEAAVSMMVHEWGIAAYGGGLRGRRPGHADLEPNCYLPCRDGNLAVVAITDSQWRGLADLMGNPAWVSEPAYRDAVTRAEHWESLHAHLREWAQSQRGLEVLEAAQVRGIPCFRDFELRDVVVSEHVQQLDSLQSIGGRWFPADPVVVNRARRVGPPPPDRAVGSIASNGRSAVGAGAPLAGLRVLDLGQIVAGPVAGQFLAALGAEVLLVESKARPLSRGYGPFVGEPKHDASMLFNQVNRGKRSVQIDLSTTAGRQVLRELVKSSDVVLENFSRRAADHLGLSYEQLASERNDIILASISGFGRTGPWGDFVALHSTVILASGLASATRDEHGRPRIVGSIYPDPLTGTFMALAIQQAVAERSETGAGCHIDVSMLDVLLTCMGGLIPAAADGDTFGPHPGRFLRTAEPDRFLAVSEPGADPQDFVEQTRSEAMAAVQANGVRAGAVLDITEVMDDPHLNARGFVLEDDHPVAGPRPIPAVPWLYDGVRPKLSHAPCLGEGTDEILTKVVGLHRRETEALRKAGVLV